MESVILQQPLALTLYGAALFFRIFDMVYKATKGRMTLISTALCIGTTAYALIMGASLWEAATVLLVFLLLNMGLRE